MLAARAAKSAGKVFLDGDEAGERHLVGQIGDAETARAQHPLDAVVADQLGPVRQGQQVCQSVPAWLASPSSQAHGYQTRMSPNPRVMMASLPRFCRRRQSRSCEAGPWELVGNNVADDGSHSALHLACISTFHREICRSDRRGGSNRWNRSCCCSRKPVGNSCCACGQCKAWARPRRSRVVRPIGRHIFQRLVRTTGPYRTRLRRRRRTAARWALREPCREASRRLPAPR